MIFKNTKKNYLDLMLIVLLSTIFSGVFAQVHKDDGHSHSVAAPLLKKKNALINAESENPYSLPQATWAEYCSKTNQLLENVDVTAVFNYIIISNDGKLSDRKKFMDHINIKLQKDVNTLIYKVGTKELANSIDVSSFLHSLQPSYTTDFKEFKKLNAENEARVLQYRAPGDGVVPVPFNCGSPCTNPGFESGTGFWDYWTGTACTSADPCFLTPGLSGTEHFIQTAGGFDPIVGGTILPVVPPGGGGSSLRLGNTAIGGQAARASMSFTVSAANSNFTYRYAVVLEDPTVGHTDPERPYFRVKIRDASGNVVTCGDYEVICKPPLVDFTRVGTTNYYYRNWTTVFVPLSSYIGQCITVEFTSSDCAQTGHLGYAYIDADCDPLEVLTSSPAVCGGSSVTLTGPSGGVTYSWTNTAGGTTGIVGPTNGQNAVVNQGGTYQVVVTSVSGPTCTTTLNITVGSSPANPVASFTNTTVCAMATTVFTDTSTPSGSVTAWAWDFNADGVTDDVNQNPSYVFPGAGTFPVTLIVTMGPCNATVTQNVTVNPGVGPAITAAGPFCVNTAPVTLNGIPGGGTWAGTGITNAATGAFDPAVAVVGNNNITYNIGGACPGTANSVIVVNPLPISNAGTDVVICSGVAASIGTAATGGYTYDWLPATGLSASNVSNPDITTVNTGASPIVTTYTVTTTEAACTSTDAVLVTVNPQPVLTITNPAPVCTPAIVDITTAAVTAGSSGGGTLSYWTDAAGTVPLAGPTGIAASGTYYIKSTTAGGCTDIEPVVVTINPLPVSDAGTDVTICSGAPAAIGTAATPGYTYNWLPATGLSAANVSNPNITTVNGGATPVVTTYTVTTTATGGCTTTDEVLVTVNPQPVLTITNPPAVCTPNTVDITTAAVTAGSTGGGTLTYWTDAAGTVPLAGPTGIAASGTYYIKVTATGGCTDIDPVVVTINPLPVSDAGTDVIICTGTPATIGSAATAGYSYSWLPATGISATNISNPDNTTVNAGASSIVTTYTVTTTITATGCQSADSVVVTVNPFPVISITDPAGVCSPNAVDITAPAVTAGTVGSGIYSYWTDAAATIALTDPAAVNVSGTYYIQLVSGAGCSDIDPVTVTINPLPVSDAGTDLVICTGSSGPIGAPAVAGFTYLWTPATGLSSAADANPNVTLTNISSAPVSTTYTVTTTNSATGCVSIDSVVVTVNIVATANAGSTQAVCAGTSLTLAGAVGGSVSGGTWSGGAGTFSPNNTTLNAVYTPTSAEYASGSITLTLTSDDPAGPCTFASSSVTFNFYQNPVVDFSVNDPSGCPVHCGIFTDFSTVAAGDAIVSWNWDFGDGSPDSTTQNTSHCYSVTGFYDVTLTVTNNHGCQSDSTQVQMVEVFPVPVAEFVASPNPASVLDPEVTLNNASSSDVIAWTYYFGDGDSIAPNVSSPVHMYPSSGPAVYTATLMVENSDGCRDTVQHPVEIGPEFTFFIPNAFTPNGDGVNDFFFGQGIGIIEYDIWIFDRWGNMIYHGDNIDTSRWDGRANNGKEVAQQDVYVWKVKLKDVFDKKHNYIGTVTLVK
jgi:gliding motility-associated-like protein